MSAIISLGIKKVTDCLNYASLLKMKIPSIIEGIFLFIVYMNRLLSKLIDLNFNFYVKLIT
jgi:hypothetical protein